MLLNQHGIPGLENVVTVGREALNGTSNGKSDSELYEREYGRC